MTTNKALWCMHANSGRYKEVAVICAVLFTIIICMTYAQYLYPVNVVKINTHSYFEVVSKREPTANSSRTTATLDNNYTIVHRKRDGVWVGDKESMAVRIKMFNNYLTSYRQRELLATLNSTSAAAAAIPSAIKSLKTFTYYHMDSKSYFRTLRDFNLGSQLTTVFLTLAQDGVNLTLGNIARQNLLITKLYRWTGVKPACIFHPFHRNNMTFDEAFCQPHEPFFSNSNRFNMTQIFVDEDSDVDSTAYGKYDMAADDNSTIPKFAFFMHVIKNAITSKGAVYVRNIHIEPKACHSTPRAVSKANALYDEVFVAAIPWGNAFYHTAIESLTKLAVALDFLRANPSIRIHLAVDNTYVKDAFRILGLDPQRIVTGAVRARVMYWPRPTCCFEAPILDLQLMSHEYRDFARRTSNDSARNSVVYIRRTKSRQFVNNHVIESVTKELSAKHGFRFELFADDALPSLMDTVYMFYRARVIVAPHGAGLVHIQYARPGTIVIEAIDLDRCCPCYVLLSHVLGLRYHAVGSDAGYEKVRVDLEDFRQSVDFHLKYAAEHNDECVTNVARL